MLGRSHYEIFPELPERWKEIHRRGLQEKPCELTKTLGIGKTAPLGALGVRPWKTLKVLPGGILILSEDITRRKQLEEAVLEVNRRLIEAQEQERNRVARELHDDIGQRLALLAVELEQLPWNLLNCPNSSVEWANYRSRPRR